jgi:hypothetical protein
MQKVDLLLQQNKQKFNLLLHRKLVTVVLLLKRNPRAYLERFLPKEIYFNSSVGFILINCTKIFDSFSFVK